MVRLPYQPWGKGYGVCVLRRLLLLGEGGGGVPEEEGDLEEEFFGVGCDQAGREGSAVV
jgi:hypothetical protein